MNNTDFIAQLSQKAGISADQAKTVSGIFDSFSISDLGSPDALIEKISSKIGVDKATAKQVYDTARGLIGDNLLSKIKNPFG